MASDKSDACAELDLVAALDVASGLMIFFCFFEVLDGFFFFFFGCSSAAASNGLGIFEHKQKNVNYYRWVGRIRFYICVTLVTYPMNHRVVQKP